MECGSWCVYYTSRGVSSVCKHCSAGMTDSRSPFGSEHVNIFELATGLQKRKQGEIKPKVRPASKTPPQPITLDICPNCGSKSFFNNMLEMKTECLNINCTPTPNIFRNIVWLQETAEIEVDYETHTNEKELTDPMLLAVKMLLADIRPWRRPYFEDEYNCQKFAQETCNRAKERGIRCGYVSISFKDNPIGHAINAFKTEHGLQFFEPQNGDLVDVMIGERYHVEAKGIHDNSIISLVEIHWNDGTLTLIEK